MLLRPTGWRSRRHSGPQTQVREVILDGRLIDEPRKSSSPRRIVREASTGAVMV